MQSWTFDSQDPEQMRERGAALGRAIGPAGLAIALVGPLGAGKTVFVKGLAEGLGVDPRLVSSPTFVIAQEYPIQAPSSATTLHHIDLYRLESEAELEAIGFFDMFGVGRVLAVEWADRFPGVLGRDVLEIVFEGPSAETGTRAEGADVGAAPGEATRPQRRARVTAHGERAQRVSQDFAQRVERDRKGAAAQGGGRSAGLRPTAEMRCLWLLGLAWLLVGAVLGSDRSGIDRETLVRGDCLRAAELGTLESDALGTLRAGCASSQRAAQTGVGRLVGGGRLDLNRAAPALLEALPGIGPQRAAAIVAARRVRRFDSTRDLERVPGIGERTRTRLEAWVRVAEEAQDG